MMSQAMKLYCHIPIILSSNRNLNCTLCSFCNMKYIASDISSSDTRIHSSTYSEHKSNVN